MSFLFANMVFAATCPSEETLKSCPSGSGGWFRLPSPTYSCSNHSNLSNYCYSGPDGGNLGTQGTFIGAKSSDDACIAAIGSCNLLAPTGLGATAGNRQISLSWSSSSGATSYTLKRGTASGSYGTTVVTQSGRTYIDTGLTNGTRYYYVVFASNYRGDSGNSSPANAVPFFPVPTNLAATGGTGKISLTWTASAGATSYTLKRSTTSGSGYATFSGGSGITGTSYTNTGLTNGTTYYYVVTATNGVDTSADSTQDSAKPIAPPATFTAIAGNAQVSLSWTASTGATSYTVERGTASGIHTTTISPGNVTSYVDSSVANGTTYYYVVIANNATGSSDDSVERSAMPRPPIPAAPTFSGLSINDSQVALSWSTVTDAATYTLKRSVTSGSGYVAIPGATNISATTYIDTGLANDTQYYYVVSATNITGTSPNSPQITGKPIATPVISAVAGTAKVTLSWNASSGATSYTIKRRLTPTGTITTLSPGNVTIYVDSTASNNTLYYYTVAAVNATGTGGDSNQVSATPIAAPTGLVKTIGDGKVNLTWSAPAGAVVTGYTVKRSLSSTMSSPVSFDAGTSLIYTDTAVANNILYYYVVVANNTTGFSSDSSQISAQPIQTPTITSAVSGTTSATLTWTPSAGATSYTLRFGTTVAMSSTPVTLIPGTTYTKTGLLNNTVYYFAVEAVNATGTGEDSNQVSAKPIAAPTGVTAVGGTSKAVISWTAVAGATSYTVKRGTANGGPYMPLPAGTNTTTISFADTDALSNGMPYYYVVVASNATGFSSDSAQVTATPMAIPANFAVMPGSAKVTLTWTNSPGATSYTVTRTNTMTPPPATATFAYNTSSSPYIDSTALNGATYWYSVVAKNTVGTSDATAQLPASPVAVPAAPTGLIATPGDAQVSLVWNASTGASSYTVSRSTTNGSGYMPIFAATDIATTAYLDIGLTNGLTYYYVVTAKNGSGASGYSAQASATPNPIPMAPLNLTAIPGNAKITLSWATSTGATGYSLQRSLTSNGITTTIAVGNVTSYVNSGLTNGQAYFYVVVATNPSGTSPKSNKVSATPQVPSSIVITLAPTPSRCSQQTVPSSVGVVEVRPSATISGGYPPYTAVWSPAPFWMSSSTSASAFLATYRYATTVELFATVVSPKIILTITDAAFGTASTSRNFVPCPSAVSCQMP